MGGITITQRDIHEIVVLGEHRGVRYVVVGTHGGDDVRDAARGLIDAFLDSSAEPFHCHALVVDVVHASVRFALRFEDEG